MYCYEISTDKWKTVISMNESRYDHSSCVLGNALYVCAGKDARDEPMYSIERTVVQDCIQGKSGAWETLSMTASAYNFAPLMVPINS